MNTLPLECLLLITEHVDIYNSILLFVCHKLRTKLLDHTYNFHLVARLYGRYSIFPLNYTINTFKNIWYDIEYNESQNVILQTICNIGDTNIFIKLCKINNSWIRTFCDNFDLIIPIATKLKSRHINFLFLILDDIKFNDAIKHKILYRVFRYAYLTRDKYYAIKYYEKFDQLILENQWPTLIYIELTCPHMLTTIYNKLVSRGIFDFIENAYRHNIIGFQQIANIAIRHNHVNLLEMITDYIPKLSSSTWDRAYQVRDTNVYNFLRQYNCSRSMKRVCYE